MDVLLINLLGDKVRKLILEKCNLNLSQIRLLLYFKNMNKDVPMQKVADDLGLSLSTLSRQINQAKTKQYINLHRSKTDSRKLLHLTQKGINKLAEINYSLSNLNKNLFSLFSKQDAEQFTFQVNILLKQLNKM